MGFMLGVLFINQGVYAETIDTRRWQTNLLEDTKPVSIVSMPGTHDSAAYTGTFSWVRTQTDTITQQLNRGIRYLDYRVSQSGEELYMYHGKFNVGNGKTLTEHFREVSQFLDQNPGEFVLIRIKKENDAPKTYEEYLKLQGMVMKSIAYSGLADKCYQNLSGIAPTVKDVRGKVLILDDFLGGMLESIAAYQYRTLAIQDHYDNVSTSQKLIDVTAQIAEAETNEARLTLNYLSHTYRASTPYTLAQEMNPNVALILKGANPPFYNVGTLIMDYPTDDLIKEIIQVNLHSSALYQVYNQYLTAVDNVAISNQLADKNKDGIVDKQEILEVEQDIQLANEQKKKLEAALSEFPKDNVVYSRMTYAFKMHPIPPAVESYDLQLLRNQIAALQSQVDDWLKEKQSVSDEELITHEAAEKLNASLAKLQESAQRIQESIHALPDSLAKQQLQELFAEIVFPSEVAGFDVTAVLAAIDTAKELRQKAQDYRDQLVKQDTISENEKQQLDEMNRQLLVAKEKAANLLTSVPQSKFKANQTSELAEIVPVDPVTTKDKDHSSGEVVDTMVRPPLRFGWSLVLLSIGIGTSLLLGKLILKKSMC